MIEAIHEFAAGRSNETTYCRDNFALLRKRTEDAMRRVADEVYQTLQNRLPGRIRDLEVSVDGDRVVLSGVSRSYYVKQVAQHAAMSALDASARGQLVNRIEVRTVR